MPMASTREPGGGPQRPPAHCPLCAEVAVLRARLAEVQATLASLEAAVTAAEARPRKTPGGRRRPRAR